MQSLIEQISSDAVINKAYEWLCQRRRQAHYNQDIWHLRFHWQTIKPKMQWALRTGNYQFSPCKVLSLNGESVGLWAAQDALVLKAITLVLTPFLMPMLSRHCYHLKGKGAKACIRHLYRALSHYRYVCRSDVNSYYATIDQKILFHQLRQSINDETVLVLLKTGLERVDEKEGDLNWQTVGLSKGSPLSPLLGALYLHQMDQRLGDYCTRYHLKYYRFMDDWVVLCKTHHQLRHVVRLMNRSLSEVKQTKHPFKTYIGRIKETRFDFLGYRLTPHNPLTPAWQTLARYHSKLLRLYEQGVPVRHVAKYVMRWEQWVKSGIDEVMLPEDVCECWVKEFKGVVQ